MRIIFLDSRDITADTLFWAGLGFKVLAALKKCRDENAAKVGSYKKNATFAPNQKKQTAMREQEESTGRQIAKIGHPRSASEPQGHIGADGRRYYTADECLASMYARIDAYFDAHEKS